MRGDRQERARKAVGSGLSGWPWRAVWGMGVGRGLPHDSRPGRRRYLTYAAAAQFGRITAVYSFGSNCILRCVLWQGPWVLPRDEGLLYARTFTIRRLPRVGLHQRGFIVRSSFYRR